MPPIYAKYYESLLKSVYSNPKPEGLKKTTEAAFLTKNDYLVHCNIQLTLSFIYDHGLCYYGLVSPIKDGRRLILINSSGEILNFSREFAEDMDISFDEEKNQWNILDFCPEFEKAFQSVHLTSTNLKAKEHIEVNNIQQKKDQKKSLAKTLTIKNQKIMPHNNSSSEDKSSDNLDLSSTDFIEESTLAFIPLSLRQLDDADFSSVSKLAARESIVYKVGIIKHMVKESQMFELKMDKILGGLDLKYPLTKRYNNPPVAKLLKTDHIDILTSVENLISPKQEYSATRFLLSNRLNGSRTPKTNEDMNAKDFVSNTEKNEISKSDILMTNSMPPLSPLLKFIPNLETQLIPATGDLHDLNANFDKESASRIELVSTDGAKAIKIPQGQALKIEKIEGNLLKVALGEGSSTQGSLLVSENVRGIQAYKMVRRVIDSRKYSRLTSLYNILFLFLLGGLLGFLIWLNIKTSNTSHEVDSLGTVIEHAYFRNYWTKVAVQDIMTWMTLREENLINWDLVYVTEVVKKSFTQTINFNKQLESSLSELSPDLQSLFYHKDIRVLERNAFDQMEVVSMDDSFQLLKKIVNKGLTSQVKPKMLLPGEPRIDKDFRFVLDNGMDDLLVATNQIIDTVKNSLFGTLSDSKNMMESLFIVTICVLVLFIAISWGYVINTNRECTKFMQTIFTLSPQQITKTEQHLAALKGLLEQDSQAADFLRILDLNEINPKLKETSKPHKNVGREAKMSKLHTRNYLIFAGLFFCISLTVGFMVLYYRQALHKITVMEKQQISLYSALEYLNTIVLISVEIEAIMFENATTTIRNTPILTSIQEEIALIKNISKLKDSLKNEDGEYSPAQEEILFSYSCDKAYSPLYSWGLDIIGPECQAMSDGLGSVSLVKLLPKLESALNQLLAEFNSGSRDLKTLRGYYQYKLLGHLAYMTDTLFILLLQSFTASTEEFEVMVKDLEEQRVVLAWIACVISFALGTFTWLIVIRRLSNIEFERNKMLGLVPNKMIFENFLIKKYIARISSGGAGEITRMMIQK